MNKEKDFDENIHSLVRKLLNGKINSDELKELNSWYDSFEGNEEIHVLTTKLEDLSTTKARLLKRINANRNSSIKFNEFFNHYKNVAALIIFFSILTAAVTIYLHPFQKDTQYVWNEIRVEDGHKKILTLSDNSKIVLNSGSYLKYPTKFSSSKREIYLEGEAYFEIEHSRHKKFIVHTPQISTTVLGTKFNINAFNNNEEISVALVEGKVKVKRIGDQDDSNSVLLKPLQQFILSTDSNRSIVKAFNIQEKIGWKDNVLIFNSKSLKYMLKVLSRTYGVKFILLNDDYNNKKITANFNNASVSTVIKSITKLTNLQYRESKDNDSQEIVFY